MGQFFDSLRCATPGKRFLCFSDNTDWQFVNNDSCLNDILPINLQQNSQKLRVHRIRVRLRGSEALTTQTRCLLAAFVYVSVVSFREGRS